MFKLAFGSQTFNICSKMTDSQLSLLYLNGNRQLCCDLCTLLQKLNHSEILCVYRYILFHMRHHYSQNSSHVLVSIFSCKFWNALSL